MGRHTNGYIALSAIYELKGDLVKWFQVSAMNRFLRCMPMILICTTSVFAQTWRDQQARLCFVRPENNGAMNTLESWIRVSDYNLPVLGGQAVCLYAQPGNSELTVTSRYPYNPQSKSDQACKSRTLRLSLSDNDNRTFLICPATMGDAYTCGWRIVEGNLKPNTGCNDR